MARKKNYLTNVTIIPAQAATEAGRFVPRQELQQLPFWQDLKEREQETLASELKQLSAARMMHVSSGLSIGEHILNIYNTCESYSGMFRKIMASFGMTDRSAYRYMETYKNAREAFPEQVLKAAIVYGLDILSYDKRRPLGKYTEVVALLPPPPNPEYAEATRYIAQLKQTYKERRKAISDGLLPKEVGSEAEEIRRDPDFLHLQSFRGIKNALTHVPKNRRRHWFESLVGMTLTQMGISNPMTFEPQAVPEEYRQGPGRPRSEREGRTVNPRRAQDAAA